MASSSSSDDDDDTLFQSHYNPPSPSSSSASSPSPPPIAHPPPTTHPSQTHLPHNFFAPPFYNRPPTPLPPSPSLTSLLRPSRPTTPDSSDNEHIGANSSRHLPVPRASPKVPTYEYYGFVLYLFSSLSFLMYLLWSYLPSPFLHFLGIYYYPNRWWSLAIPAWLVMLLVYIYVALAAYNTGTLTLGLGELGTVVDEAANVAVVDGAGRVRSSFLMGGPLRGREREIGGRKGYGKERKGGGSGSRGRGDATATGFSGLGVPGAKWDWKQVWSEGTDAVMDVPLGGVCEVLYGDGREDQFDGEG